MTALKWPTVLILGYTGSGKTSILKELFGAGIVSEDCIGHGNPTTQDFKLYQTSRLRIYDSQGLEAGDGIEDAFVSHADTFIKSLRNSPDIDQHVHVMWYCIDGSRARVTPCDLRLLRTIWKPAMVLITKSDIMRPDQYNEIVAVLKNNGIDSMNILPCSIYNVTQLDGLRNRTLQLWPQSRRIALLHCMQLKATATYREHKQRVWSVAFSPKSDFLVSAGKDKQVVVRQIDEMGNVIERREFGTQNDVNCVRFSPDGKFIAYGDDDGKVWLRLFDRALALECDPNVATDKLENYCYSVAFHPFQPLLAVGTKANKTVVYEYSIACGVLRLNRLWTFRTANAVRSATFNHDGSCLFFADDDGKLWRVKIQHCCEKVEDWMVSKKKIRTIDTHPSRPIIALSGKDKCIRVVELIDTIKPISELKCIDQVCSLKFSPDGELIIFGSGDGKIGVWDWDSNKNLIDQYNSNRYEDVYSVDISPNHQFIATGSWDNNVRLWSIGDCVSSTKASVDNIV